MKTIFRLFPVIIILIAATVASAQNVETGSAANRGTDIIAFIEPPQLFSELSPRLARLFVRELDLVSNGQSLDVKFYDGPQADFKDWANNQDCRYMVSVEIIKRGWFIDRSFQVPFLFHIYRNNFKLRALLKLYRQGVTKPILLKEYEIKVGGPRVYQIIESNPQDGGLMIPYSRRAVKESRAEKELAAKLSKDIYKTMERYGG